MLKELVIWRRFQREITDNDLKIIAEADYGFDAKDHFQALKNILVSGQLPECLEWEPREVLSLVSWNEYWNEDEFSRKQAYFCSVILLAASQHKLSNDYLHGQIEKMIIAIDASRLLGQERTENLYEFFQYLLPKIQLNEVEEDFLYFNLSVFILASILNQPLEDLEKLIDNVIYAEQEVASHCHDELHRNIFDYTCFDQRIEVWKRYYKEFAELLEERRVSKFGAIWR